MLLTTLTGCASKTASYYYTQKQIDSDDLTFHKRIRIDEYINAFPQDEIVVPENNDIVVQVDPFTKVQPAGNNRALIQIAVKTRLLRETEARMNMSICFVLDVSGSMYTESKIDDALSALAKSIAELQEGDEIAIIAFDSSANIEIPAQKITRQSKKWIIKAIERINGGGGTNIQAGLVTGYREMAKFTSDGPKRLLLITDGRSNIRTMTPKQIARKARVNYLEGLRISTIGLGHDVDEKRLRKLAENGRGHYYFADNAKTLTTILREDIHTTMVPLAKAVRLNLSVAEGFTLLNVYGYSEKVTQSNSAAIDIGELNVNDWRIMIAEIEGSVPPGSYIPITAEVVYEDLQSGVTKTTTATTSVNWHRGNPDNRNVIHENVARNSVLFGNAATLVKVGELSEEENYHDALEIVSLQINNNRIMQQLDDTGSMDKEIESLTKVRNILVRRIEADEQAKEKTIQRNYEGSGSSTLRNLIGAGLSIARQALPGLWGTVAELFIALIE